MLRRLTLFALSKMDENIGKWLGKILLLLAKALDPIAPHEGDVRI
jgi:hypothetical protein